MLKALTIRLPEGMMNRIEAIQAGRMDEPDKGQVIRELLAEALEARDKKAK